MKIKAINAFLLALFLIGGCDLIRTPLFYHWPEEDKGKSPVYAKDIFNTRQGDKLAKAIVGKKYQKVEELIRNETLVNETGIYGITPLWLAVLINDERSVRLMLENAGDPNPKVTFVEPSVVLAAEQKGPILGLLLEHGADPETENRGKPCLFYASEWRQHIDLLLAAGADINQRAEDGETTIMLLASRILWIDTIVYLLEQGADPTLQDLNKRTLVDIMDSFSERGEHFKKRFTPVYQWMETHGYDLNKLRNPEWEMEWENEKRRSL